MHIPRWFTVAATSGALVAGGGAALANASGEAVPAASRTHASLSADAAVNHQLQLLLAEESALTAQINDVRQQLSQAAASEQAKVAAADQAITGRESQLEQQEAQLSAEESAIRQEAAQLSSAQGQSSAQVPARSSGGGDD